MKNNLRCSIVIRTHNHAKLLEKLLKKIEIQKNVLKPEIVIIDSSSTDNTQNIAKKYECKFVQISKKDFGHSYTLNLGAENSKNEIIVYVSVDIIPKNNLWLFHLIKHFEDGKIAGTFGKQEPIPNFNPIEEFKIKKMFPDGGESVAFFSCASGAIRKSLWKKIKYDETMPYKLMGGQDQTWAIDVKKLGYKILYEPKSIVYHSHKYSLESRLHLAYMDGKYSLEIEKWNKDVAMLEFKKMDLVKYLIKKQAYKELIWDLLSAGVLMRIAGFWGKMKRFFKTTN